MSQSNPFTKKNEKNKVKESIIRSTLLFFTYFIILCAFAIFGNIIYNGAPVLWERGLGFLTEKPQTLNVIEIEKTDNVLVPQKNFDQILNANHENEDAISNVEEVIQKNPFTSFTLQKGSSIGEGHLKLIEAKNKGFFLFYNERDKTTPISFTLSDDKKITLPATDFEQLKQVAPDIIPSDASAREIKLTNYEVTIKKGQYPLSKPAFDALVPTNLIYQMTQPFADDEPDKLINTVIPKTQTISVPATIYFSAFDEEEKGTLPVAEQKETPIIKGFVDLVIPKGTHKISQQGLAILSTQGVSTLHNTSKGSVIVPEDQKKLELSTADFKQLQLDNPSLKVADITTFETETKFTSFSINRDTELLIDVQDREQLRIANSDTGNFNPVSEKTYSYSGGGILGPIVGTILLVIICMVIALFTGIAASIFLNEYARKGTFVKSVRLAMLNLAGVPSIVFGLFGLGLFVLLAPTLTSTPQIPRNKANLLIPVTPFASEPNLRIAEQENIYIAPKDNDLSTSESVKAAVANGSSKFYNGCTYISLQGWGNCMLAGGFTLAIMVLPVIITSCEESLRAVPMGFREASLALGATKWQSIRTAVLPYAFPGILTASVLGITRVAGETAPIMFTAAVAEKSDLPWDGLQATGFSAFIDFLQQSVQALPYHIYTITKLPDSEYSKPMQFGSVFVFMLIVMTFATFSVWLRIRVRNKLKW